jgi:hypothetical protein
MTEQSQQTTKNTNQTLTHKKWNNQEEHTLKNSISLLLLTLIARTPVRAERKGREGIKEERNKTRF